MPRPRSDNPSPGALRMRKLREQGRQLAEASERPPSFAPKNLVLVPVWVPRGDEKVIQTTAQRLRKAARISEDEVPE